MNLSSMTSCFNSCDLNRRWLSGCTTSKTLYVVNVFFILSCAGVIRTCESYFWISRILVSEDHRKVPQKWSSAGFYKVIVVNIHRGKLTSRANNFFRLTSDFGFERYWQSFFVIGAGLILSRRSTIPSSSYMVACLFWHLWCACSSICLFRFLRGLVKY